MSDSAVLANRRAYLTIFSRPSGLLSHLVRVVVREKNLANVNIEFLRPGDENEDLVHLKVDTASELPVLIDRQLVLTDVRTILEYIDERFPHPPLMPIDPAERAAARQAIEEIRGEFYKMADIIENGSAAKVRAARKSLISGLTGLATSMGRRKYFLGSEISLVDCAMAPVLWRLGSLGVKMPGSAENLDEYAQRLFARPAFKASLTEIEEGLRV